MESLVPARLILESNEVFEGMMPSFFASDYFGEVVFNTGMTGYVESLTDPSYCGQILTFTYPLIGNYGFPKEEFFESSKAHPAAIIVNELNDSFFHYQAQTSLLDFLKKNNVAVLMGVDTRALTKLLRHNKSNLGVITKNVSRPKSFFNPNLENLSQKVSITKPAIYGSSEKKIIAIDCGMKENILRNLLKYPVSIKKVPAEYDFTNEHFDAVFISNGPGDPVLCIKTIEIIKKAMKLKKPIFGICLGAQLLALSANAKTKKLDFGHRGQNHPCIHLEDKKCYLTSQNHGFEIEEKSLSEDWMVTFRNLNDHSVEGIAHKTLPFFAVQFHPESSPGPSDTTWLFDKFYQMIQNIQPKPAASILEATSTVELYS